MKDHFEILIIDDSTLFSQNLKDILDEKGYRTVVAHNGKDAVEACRQNIFSLALIDLNLPDYKGMDLVEELSVLQPEMEFIIITGYGTMEIAVEAVRHKKIVSFEVKPVDLNHFLALVHQIQERRRAAEALRISEQRFHIFAESATDAIISTDETGRIIYMNPEFENIFGHKIPEMLGREITNLMNLKENQDSSDVIRSILDLDRIREMRRMEVQGKHKSGTIIPLEISLGGYDTKDGTFYIAIVRDITERKKIEKQLIHTERMAGIGVMAAGMAHEINQPLNNISLTMDNLVMSIKEGTANKAYIEGKTNKIFDHITRIRKIIDHVRAFSRDHDDYILSKFDINESIRNAKSLVSEQFRHNGIEFELELDESLPNPVGNIFKFEQVIVNLTINAKDAIEEKELHHTSGFNKYYKIRSFREDNYICVEAVDNGIGIEPNEIDKIMLPFYSTKLEGMGTGLGLSISFGIIRDMNGTIEIHSKRFAGTTIKIMIPIGNKEIS
ncbi:MAG: PAS domain S-box protein [Bacteroidetes bacterium]|nr:PAS domain S-box protein [Bacteroidota bacterium]